jgi:lysine decarboxylase/arginine decarboxylase
MPSLKPAVMEQASMAVLQAAVEQYVSQTSPLDGALIGPLRLHIPGHKGGTGAPPDLLQRWGAAIFRDDLTEVPGVDDLAAPAGPIAAAQAEMARLFGAGRVFCLVQGTTGGLIALLLAAARGGTGGLSGRQVVILPRHSHRALVSAMILAGLRPVFCRTTYASGLPAGPDLAHIASLLAEHRGAVAGVVDAYPNMYGVVHDLKQVSDLCRGARVPLYVDGAHASLFGLDDRLPAAPLTLGADAVVISAHKGLGSLTQSSLLLVAEQPVGPSAGDIAAALRLVTTTSPSYLLMLSLEAATRYMFSPAGRRQLALAVAAASDAPSMLAGSGTSIIRAEGPGITQDPMRLNLDAWSLGLTGLQLATCLRQRAGVQVESADWRSVLVVLGASDHLPTIARLAEALAVVRDACSSTTDDASESSVLASAHRLQRAQQQLLAIGGQPAMEPRTAWLAATEDVQLSAAAGRIAAEAVSPYPPGVPIVWPGEIIPADVVAVAEAVIAAGGGLHGVVRSAADGEWRLSVVAREES